MKIKGKNREIEINLPNLKFSPIAGLKRYLFKPDYFGVDLAEVWLRIQTLYLPLWIIPTILAISLQSLTWLVIATIVGFSGLLLPLIYWGFKAFIKLWANILFEEVDSE